MADTKISALTALDAFASGDLIPMVDDPSGTPVTKKATINQVRDYIIALANTWTATQTIDPADNTSALAVSGFSLTGSNAQSLIDLAGTWNTTGTPTAIKLNVTDTASNASSLLLDLQVGGASAFNVTKGGSVKLGINSSGTNVAGTNVVIAGSQGTGTGAGGSIIFQVAPAGSSGTAQNALATALTINSARNFVVSTGAIINQTNANDAALKFGADHIEVQYYAARVARIGSGGLTVRGDVGVVGWAPSSDTSVPSDLALRRDAANTLALRNGTNAQAFNIYNTYTDASNYERGIISWVTNTLRIGAEAAGTGTVRAVNIFEGSNVWIFSGGNLSAPGSIEVPSVSQFRWASRSRISSPSDGVVRLTANTAANGSCIELIERTAPSAPAANEVRIYAQDNGGGKTQLMALFPTGAAQQIAIEP